MTYTEAEAQVREIIDDTSATVSNMIANSVKFLNVFFGIDKWDESKTTIAGQSYVDVSDLDILDIYNVYVGNEEIAPLEDENLANLPKFEEEEINRWYFADGKIYFVVAPDVAGETVKIFYKKRYLIPTGTALFDTPREFDELIVLGAVYRYYGVLLSKVASSREDMPDISPNEIRLAQKRVGEQYDEIFNKILKSHAI